MIEKIAEVVDSYVEFRREQEAKGLIGPFGSHTTNWGKVSESNRTE